jgi:hypothetical protein
MKLEMTICDRCAKPVPSGTGALVLVYGGADNAHLCEECLRVVLPNMEDTMKKLKGEEDEKNVEEKDVEEGSKE